MEYNTEKEFDRWNDRKKAVHFHRRPQPVKNREIWWTSVGENIGDEQNGKNELFERPVLVLRVFNTRMFLGIPITSRPKNEKSPYYFKFTHEGHVFFLLIPQMRLFSSQRALRLVRRMDVEEFARVKDAVRSLLHL